MLIIKLIRKLLKALSSGGTPAQLAAGFLFGMFIGITPFWSLLNTLFLFILIIVNVNMGTAVLGFILFSSFSYMADGLFHFIGFWLLVDIPFLQGFWKWLYDLPLIPFTAYNNTTYLGSLISAIIFAVPVYYGFKSLVAVYRNKLEPVITRWKIVKVLKSTKIFSAYSRLKAS